jgi:hypothetical protein
VNDTTPTAPTRTQVQDATTGLLTISQVCRALPGARGNRTVNPSTVTRWIVIGCPARNGERVKLSATRCGSRWLIDPAHLAEFFEALGSITPNSTVPTPRKQRTEAQRQSAAARALRELKRRGA